MLSGATLGKTFALDKASLRSVDVDGRMHVKATVICMAAVNPYLGSEIPDYEQLKLDPQRVYNMFRPPEEIQKGAATSNNIQLLDEHVAVDATDPQKERTVGSTGTDATFDGKHLINSLVIWDAQAIKDVEADKKREMSPSYRYTPDMTPGEWEGAKFDGIMRNISFNHIALVEEGRQGPYVVVADKALKVVEPMAGLLDRVSGPSFTRGLLDRMDDVPLLDQFTFDAEQANK